MNKLQKFRATHILNWVSLLSAISNSASSKSILYVSGHRFYGAESKFRGKKKLLVRNEAQAAVMEYFHLTRSLNMTDAENMTKNAPEFFNKLLAKVEIDSTRVGPSVARFLRYNPVNEFEPFFESIGLKPDEYGHFLPKDLMFLADDGLLLKNYYALCNYGVERKRIGKIYKEATEVFRFDYGVLSSRLKCIENLGLRQTLVAKVVSFDPSLLMENVVSEDFVEFLKKLKNVGVEDNWLEMNISEEDSCSWKCMNWLLCYLSEMGFSKKGVQELLTKHPGLLLHGSSTFRLIGFLLKFGLKMKDIQSLFLKFPQMPVSRFTHNLFNCYDFLLDIDMAVLDIGAIVRSQVVLLGSCELKQRHSVQSLLQCGKHRMREMVKEDPFVLEKWVYGVRVDPLGEPTRIERASILKTKFLLRLGFKMETKEMEKAHKQIRGNCNELQERFDCLVKNGFSRDDIIKAIKVCPEIFNQSSDTIVSKIRFFLNDLGYRVCDLLSYPKIITYKIQRLKLRLLMYKWLHEQGSVRPDLHISTLLAMSEGGFVKTYVNSHAQGPKFWEILKKKVSSNDK